MILKLIIEKLKSGRMVRRMELLVLLVVLPLEPTELSGAFDCYNSIFVRSSKNAHKPCHVFKPILNVKKLFNKVMSTLCESV